MKTQITSQQKLADWELAFNSMNNLQNDEALKGLIKGLRTKIGVITPGVA
jgi:hypothetical protein